jgi:putative glutamine amidotransferase
MSLAASSRRGRPLILISQRVSVDPATAERRDGLDQRWSAIAAALDCRLWAVPNDPSTAARIIEEAAPDGVILSGGNTVGADLGSGALRSGALAAPGDAPERDRTERMLIEQSIAAGIPVVGICRGMQALNVFWGGSLRPVDRNHHVARRHPLAIEPGADRLAGPLPPAVNSYHALGITREDLGVDLRPLATCDAVIEAFVHRTLPQLGIMWHPERDDPVVPANVALLARHLRAIPAAR